jgi:hypothetical protein
LFQENMLTAARATCAPSVILVVMSTYQLATNASQQFDDEIVPQVSKSARVGNQKLFHRLRKAFDHARFLGPDRWHVLQRTVIQSVAQVFPVPAAMSRLAGYASHKFRWPAARVLHWREQASVYRAAHCLPCRCACGRPWRSTIH